MAAKKKKLLILIGVLVAAIVAAAAWLVYLSVDRSYKPPTGAATPEEAVIGYLDAYKDYDMSVAYNYVKDIRADVLALDLMKYDIYDDIYYFCEASEIEPGEFSKEQEKELDRITDQIIIDLLDDYEIRNVYEEEQADARAITAELSLGYDPKGLADIRSDDSMNRKYESFDEVVSAVIRYYDDYLAAGQPIKTPATFYVSMEEEGAWLIYDLYVKEYSDEAVLYDNGLIDFSDESTFEDMTEEELNDYINYIEDHPELLEGGSEAQN
ncbi:MAG: hypothetical protein IJH75_00215 [Mogibacterium sp.]|nr:hypothetical protein [Mogibacterium sp.]